MCLGHTGIAKTKKYRRVAAISNLVLTDLPSIVPYLSSDGIASQSDDLQVFTESSLRQSCLIGLCNLCACGALRSKSWTHEVISRKTAVLSVGYEVRNNLVYMPIPERLCCLSCPPDHLGCRVAFPRETGEIREIGWWGMRSGGNPGMNPDGKLECIDTLKRYPTLRLAQVSHPRPGRNQA